jgi:ribokinase
MSESIRPVVAVVGSLHYDIMVDAPDRPRKGETVIGHAWRPKFGGKGGNQAVAAARAGATARFAGAIGNDAFGDFLLERLIAGEVDATHVLRLPGQGSGMSVAISDAEGDYGAVVVSGANRSLDPAGLNDPALWRDVGVLILQNEMSEAVNLAAAHHARRVGALVCLNAAPFRPLSPDLATSVDVLVVNALEAEGMGTEPVTDLDSAERAALALSPACPFVVVTAGGAGLCGVERGKPPIRIDALPVTLVSTHGAGDMFVGTLAAELALGRDFAEGLHAANAAAADHVSAPLSG